MILDEHDVQELGAKGRGGRPLKPVSGPEHPMKPILAVLREMTAAITEAVAKRAEPSHVTVKAPDVTVEAPKVTVEAPITKPALEWEAEITQRDNSGRMKKFRIRAIT